MGNLQDPSPHNSLRSHPASSPAPVAQRKASRGGPETDSLFCRENDVSGNERNQKALFFKEFLSPPPRLNTQQRVRAPAGPARLIWPGGVQTAPAAPAKFHPEHVSVGRGGFRRECGNKAGPGPRSQHPAFAGSHARSEITNE